MRLGVLFVFLGLTIFCLVACAMPQQESIPEFWNWFQLHEERLFEVLSKKPTDEVMNEVGDRLRSINDGLAFEVGKAPEGKSELDVSAEGVAELFPVVEKIVAAAPKMKHWSVVAFRQRTPPETLKDLAITLRNTEGSEFTFAVSDLKASAKRKGDKAVVTLYLKGDSESDELRRMSWIMLQQAIGEYDMVKRVDAIRYAPLSEASKENTVPLARLGERFDKEMAAK